MYSFYNAPVVLLDGFIPDTRGTLNNVFDYCFYEACHKIQEDLPYAEPEDKMQYVADKILGAEIRNIHRSFTNGEALYNSIPQRTARAPIHRTIFWDYYDNEKTDFEKACFLFLHAIKSILGANLHAKKKITNIFILSRMDGQNSSYKSLDELSPDVRKYSTEHYLRKIKGTFQKQGSFEYAGLVFFGFHIRGGCWYAFDTPLHELMIHAELHKQKNRDKLLKAERDALHKKVLASINNKAKSY